jgi:imidazole glycerol-phosphate synthase subunit HisF
LIARLDVKGENLIKGVHLEGLRVVGSPQEFAQSYYEQGADELIYMDIVASLYGRSNLVDIVRRTAHDVFIPMTVGGGIRSVSDVSDLLHAGADKVAINTAAVKCPELIAEVSRKFGSQCMVLSIEAKRSMNGSWEVYTDCGRESTGIDVVKWARRGVELGAGEILITSIDMEGTRKGFDCSLVAAIASAVDVQVIASGGYGRLEHLQEVVEAGADAVAFADALHFQRTSIRNIRESALQFGIPVRQI